MSHTLEIVDGKLYAYGDNTFGQLGLGHNKKTIEKALVLTNTSSDNIPWINSEVGRFHSVGLKEDGSLWVWGDNRFGQLAQDIKVEFANKPIKLVMPQLENSDKKIELITGYYFTIFYQYLEAGYGFGEFENFDSDFVSQYREIVPLTPNNGINRWVTIDTGPKTIVGLNAEGGYKYSDWSGELFSKTYVRFNSLKLGDIFTLYDPGNRDRVLYKKVRTFSKGRGCCPVNALCLHRTYKELVSNVPPNIFILENQISVFDILDPETRQDFLKPILSVKEKYGTDFVFKSAIARHINLSKYKGLDPWTMNAMFTITGSKNTLDMILYDSLYFSEDLNELLNSETTVEKISAKEVFEPYNEFDLPPYLLNRSGYDIRLSSYTLGNDTSLDLLKDTYFNAEQGMNERKIFTMPFGGTSKNGPNQYTQYPYLYKINPVTKKPMRFTFSTRYGYGIPVYRSKEGKLTDFDSDNPDDIYYDENKKFQGVLGCPYSGEPKYIRELEQDDSLYNQELLTHIIDLPIDETGEIISAKHIINDPYLIRFSMELTGSSFKQAFMDPTKRITTKYDGNINTIIENTDGDPMMFYTLVPDPTYTGISASPPKITVFYIGELTRSLIQVLLDDNTPAREVHDYFGISKATLGQMWKLVINASYPYKNDEKSAFARLSSLFYNKLKDQAIINEFAEDVLQTGIDTISSDQFYNYGTLQKTCNIGRILICFFLEGKVNMPYLGASCWTDRTDRSKLIIFGNYIENFKPGKTQLRYETWSGNSIKTKAGNDVKTFTVGGGIVVAKDAYQEHVTTVDVLGASFDPSEYRTIVQLRTPFSNNYLIGNLLFRDNSQYQAMPFIYFNSIASITEKLQSIPAPLAN
jgi:hypothetical protein